jgi:cyclophilin family peptidyl-prolyl cis-trans isomerase
MNTNRFVRLGLVLVCSVAVLTAWTGCKSDAPAANPRVLIKTGKGDIEVELFAKEAPATVSNFLGYVEARHYDGTIFHRVIADFMIQGGGFTPALEEKPTRPPIQNEAFNGLKNTRGTLAMARTPAVHSASSQFFINVVDNPPLDHRARTPDGFGYCVFGRVVKGMEVVDAIRVVKTTTVGDMENVPAEPVAILEARRL